MRMKHWKLVLTLTAAVSMIAAGCGDDDDDATTTTGEGGGGEISVPGDGPSITIGAQDFGESVVLAEVYGQALDAAGYPVEQQSLGGFRDIVYQSFEAGDINFTAEYAASALEFLNGDETEATADIEETAAAMDPWLADRGLQALEPAPAVDSNSFVVTGESDLTMVSELTEDMTLGGPPDCETNAFCIPGLIDVYGIDMSANFVPLDGGGPLTVDALESGEIDVAILFSTDPVIAENGWTVLEDDQGLINADNIIPVLTDDLVEAYGDDLVSLVNSVSEVLTTSELTELNRRHQLDLEEADVVATDWLSENGFTT